MTTTEERIQLDDMSIAVRRSARRKSVGITVDRDGSVSVAAPLICAFDKIDEYVKSRSLWIYKKLAQRDKLVKRDVIQKEFVDGASFYFLGIAYRLSVTALESNLREPPLRLVGDRFVIRQSVLALAPTLFRRWYVQNGFPIVERLATQLASRIAAPREIEIRDIGYRWGSCTSDGKILISWRAIQLPLEILEYVVAHEMVHLLHRNHDSEFWAHLEKVLSDFEKRKGWLAENGEQFTAEF